MRTNGGILLLKEYFLFFFQLFQHINMVMHCYLVLYSY